MTVHFVKFNLLIMIIIILNACTEPVTYAPVKVVNQALPPDNGYVPERLPGSTEGFANKPEDPQTAKQYIKPEQTLTIKQTATPDTGSVMPGVSAIKKDAPTTQLEPKTFLKTSKPKAEAAKKNVRNSAKMLTGSQNQNNMLTASENSKLKSRLSDTIHPPKVLGNGEKRAQKDQNKLYKSNININNRDKDTKKQIKTLDKPEISEKNNKSLSFSTDNKKILKLNFQWPLQGRILKSFSQTEYKGIEIAGKTGQTVYASEAGKAVYCGHGLAGFGSLAIIKHNETYLSAYANNSHLMVREGQLVGKGQAIGQLGQTGFKKAALHFEIRKNGKPINPLTVLPQN